MNAAIIVSKLDPAGLNIAKQLEQFPLPKNMFLHFIEERQIFADSVNDVSADVLVFASKHSSAAGKKSLTVHPVGNWGKAELGGKERKLVKTCSFLMKHYLNSLRFLQSEMRLDFMVSLEATHHGPYVEKPVVFIELGSSEQDWLHENGALAVAKTIATATRFDGDFIPCIALGGSHYLSKFYDLETKTRYAIGHAASQHELKNLDEEMIRQAMQSFTEGNPCIVYDERGLGDQLDRVLNLLQWAASIGITVKPLTEALKEK